MTSTTTSTGLLARIRDAVADLARGQEVLWAAMERIDPDPDPHLHWEPTASGWRLYGHLVPPGGRQPAGWEGLCEFRPLR